MQRSIASLVLMVVLAGCAAPGQRPSGKLDVDRDAAGPEPEFTVTPITPQLVLELGRAGSAPRTDNPELDQELARFEYRVGPQDVLTFIVWDHPELTIPAGEYRSPESSGHRVGNDGMLFFPYVGEVGVAGKTLREIRLDLTQRLEKFIARPQLDVRVAAFRSQRVLVTGEVKAPGVQPITEVPLTVVDAVNLAGGALQSADLRAVVLVRDGQARTLDLQALLEYGDLRHNALLRDGDVVTVPDSNLNRVHVLGEVRKPGTVAMYRGAMSLADAIGMSDSFDSGTSDPGRIFVVRGAPDAPQVFWLDGRSPESMLLAARFPMRAQDVVYVSRTSLTGWNRIVNQLMPTIEALYKLTIVDRDLGRN